MDSDSKIQSDDLTVYPGSLRVGDFRVNIPIESISAGGAMVAPWAQQAIYNKYIVALGDKAHEQFIEDIPLIEAVIQDGVLLHQSEEYDFHGLYVYKEEHIRDGVGYERMVLITVSTVAATKKEDPPPPQADPQDEESPNDGHEKSNDPYWCETEPDDRSGDYGPYSDSYNSDREPVWVSDPLEDEGEDEGEDGDEEKDEEKDEEENEDGEEDEGDDESSKTNGSEIIDGCLPTMYFNPNELAPGLASDFVDSVAAQVGVDRYATMTTMAPGMLIGARRY